MATPRPMKYSTDSMDWMAHAACQGHDPDMFFPLNPVEAFIPQAVCARCPVVQQCGDLADQSKAVGVWGGTLRTDDTYKQQPHSAEELAARHLPRLFTVVTTPTQIHAARVLGVDRQTIRATVDWAVSCGYWARGSHPGVPGRVTQAGMAALRDAGLVAA